jgi:hypothetical protein
MQNGACTGFQSNEKSPAVQIAGLVSFDVCVRIQDQPQQFVAAARIQAIFVLTG